MLSDILIPKLEQRFPGSGMRINSTAPFAVFPAIHPDVGNIEIFDDGDELTVVAGNFTHGHFSNYDQNLSVEQKEELIAEEVLHFLEDLFADRVVLWGSHQSNGGWYYRKSEDSPPQQSINSFLWSGPLFSPPTPQPPITRTPAVWLATGLLVGLVSPAPGTVGALWGLPLSWAIAYLPWFWWRVLAILAVNLLGIPLATAAGRALGGKKDNQAICCDEFASMPIVFLITQLANWKIGLAGFLLHRAMDITKPPPARQLERLPDGLGVMADDWIAAIYACLLLAGLSWIDRAAGWQLLAVCG